MPLIVSWMVATLDPEKAMLLEERERGANHLTLVANAGGGIVIVFSRNFFAAKAIREIQCICINFI